MYVRVSKDANIAFTVLCKKPKVDDEKEANKMPLVDIIRTNVEQEKIKTVRGNKTLFY